MSSYRASIKYKRNGEWTTGNLMPFVPDTDLEDAVNQAEKGLEDGEELVVIIPPEQPNRLIHKTKDGDNVETNTVTEGQQKNLTKIFDDLQGSSKVPNFGQN